MVLSLIAVFGLLTFSFFLIHLTPGDPADLILSDGAVNSLDRQMLKKQMGLEGPLLQRYFDFLLKAVRLDFGSSLYDQKPVWLYIQSSFFPTAKLALAVLFLAVLGGLPLGVLAAVYKKSFFSRGAEVLSVFSFSLPVFFTAPLLIWCFALYWPLLPVSEQGGVSHFVLPSVSLALPLGAALFQMSRASLSGTLQQDYIRTAFAKGLSSFTVYFKHALKPALIPLVTTLGLQAGALLTGVVIVEAIFDWPGMGLMLFRAVSRRDYPVIQGGVFFIALTYLMVNLTVDGAYRLIHPKIKSQK